MGLDNGITLKIKDREKFGEIPAWLIHESWEPADEYEVHYWRKCWNVRGEILNYFHVDMEGGDDYSMGLSDLVGINELLKPLYSRSGWDESLSIWAWKDIKSSLLNRLKYAEKVAKWLKDKPIDSYQLYFYDSY
jgi:hypothetical protein